MGMQGMADCSQYVLGQLDIRTNLGPPFQDLTLGWIKAESDNYTERVIGEKGYPSLVDKDRH